jgi:hypothetical protein
MRFLRCTTIVDAFDSSIERGLALDLTSVGQAAIAFGQKRSRPFAHGCRTHAVVLGDPAGREAIADDVLHHFDSTDLG